jgi:DnaJ-class molecular chaperone
MTRYLKCLACLGTGWGSPPRENRAKCRECDGRGEVPETHAWAGYVATYDFCRCPRRNRRPL